MNFIDSIKKRAKEDIKTIVLPESMDRRVLEAAVKVMKEDIAKVIIIIFCSFITFSYTRNILLYN